MKKETRKKVQELDRGIVAKREEYMLLPFGHPDRVKLLREINSMGVDRQTKHEALKRMDSGRSYMGDIDRTVCFKEYSTYRRF